MKRCKSCGQLLPFDVPEGKSVNKSSVVFCGFCVNPRSYEWIERYVEWLEKQLQIQQEGNKDA